MATNGLHLNSRLRLAAGGAAAALAMFVAAPVGSTLEAETKGGNLPTRDASPTATRCGGSKPATIASAASTRPRRWSYDWPLKPFTQQHPVRGFFNDPRESQSGSDSFHFGIDIAARDGTAVYAIAAGTVYRSALGAVAVGERSGRVFGYWHIVPVVRHHQYVARRQLLGHIAKGWGHVHFAESRGGLYVNPLRPGGIGPYDDDTLPSVARMRVEHDHSGYELVVDAFDTTPVRVARPWNDMPVTPALIRWRLIGTEGPTPWRTGFDSRFEKADNRRFWDVYARETRKNHPPRRGRYCFRVARWDATQLRPGTYRVEVAISDTGGNRTLAAFQFIVS